MINYKPYATEEFHNFISRLYPNDKHIRQITFQVTENCCLKCTYCYQNHKTTNKLSWGTSKLLIDNLLNDYYKHFNRFNTKGIIIDFIGGEPLLEIELMDQIVEYFFDQMIQLNHPWLYYTVINISSNGVLYTNKKAQDFFQKYHFLCTFNISIDGNKELHDSCRIDQYGKGSYDQAMQAVKDYRLKYNKITPTKMTLAPENISYLSQAVFNLIQEGYTEIFLNCIFEEGWTLNHAKILYQELKIVSNYLLDNDLYNKIYLSLYDEEGFRPMTDEETENWCGGTVSGNSWAIDYQGKIYPCIRYMESSLNGHQEPIYFGTIKDGLCNTKKDQDNYEKVNNITRQSQSSQECLNCPIAKGCAWCSAYNYEVTGSVNKRVTYICVMHKARALANVYYWNSLYRKLNLPLNKINYLPDDESLKIINQSELNNLNSLIMEE